MDGSDFVAQVRGVAALADPVRGVLYGYVVAQREPVSRDQASEGTGVARHTAKFHLDKLVDVGLLVTTSKRLSGRQGPGAGRPSKLYARSDREVSVSVPERRYELAGHVMAQALEASGRDSTAVVDALYAAAAHLGAALGEEARAEAGAQTPPAQPTPAQPTPGQVMLTTCQALAAFGYEPRPQGKIITLVNCPFDALAREHTALVCGMNLALVAAFAQRLAKGSVVARLDPAKGRCCVVLAAG